MTSLPGRPRSAMAVLICLYMGLWLFAAAAPVNAGAVRPGFSGTMFPPNDDGTFPGAQPLGFTANFFGLSFTGAFVNNNGNVTFDAPLSTFTPFPLTSTSRQIIAPFFADVDTRSAGDPVTFGPGMVDGHTAFGVNWINVDYFSSSLSHTNRNSFQLVLTDRSDTGVGNFDIEFNYDQIQWETGTFSGGDVNGLGGSCARAGFSNGTGAPGTFFELSGSATCGAFLDSNMTTGLIRNSLNSDVLGRYDFSAREGTVSTEAVPEPGTLFLLGSGLAGLGAWRTRARQHRKGRELGHDREADLGGGE